MDDELNFEDVLAAWTILDAQRRSGRGGLGGLDVLNAMARGGEPEKRATEREVVMDPMQRMGQFRNQPYAPHATGVPYIFTGGSPFPQTAGQQRAENVLAGGMFTGNLIDTMNSVVPAIVDAWRKRKGTRGGM